MEAAAKQIRALTQRILPDRPHHLSFSPDSRYRVGPNAKGPEEYIHRRLQYMTLVSDGDRGVLLTRPYYDMREEPPTSSAKEAAAPTRSDRKPATKMSLSDYKNKVKHKSQSPLPPTDTQVKKVEEPTARPTQERRGDDLQLESWNGDRAPLMKDPRAPGPRETLASDRLSTLAPRQPPARGPSRSPGGRKRGSDEETTPRPAKRSKAGTNGATLDEKSREKKDSVRSRSGSDAPRNKDVRAIINNAPERSDGKSGTSTSSAANGRNMLKAAMSSAHNGSPNARSRAGSMNGSRHESSGGSAKSTPVKQAVSSEAKSTVPPLLSPLHFSFDGTKSPPRKADRAAKRDEQPDGHGHRSTSKTKVERLAAAKKAKSPLMIPTLLSPTLPSFIEEELVRRRKMPPRDADAHAKPHEHSKNAKRQQVASKDVGKPKRERLIVTLKYPKRLSKRVQRLLALPGKNERPGSVDPQAQQQPLQTSKKRPLQSSGPPEFSGEALSTATKRPRKSEGPSASKAGAAPSTPPRPSSTMDHVNTPGESGPGSSSQPSQALPASQVPLSVARLRQRHERFTVLGTKLKHTRDAIAKRFPLNQLPDAEHKLSVVTGIEATLSYMIGFRSLFDSRRSERKQPDPVVWRSLLPFVTQLQRQARKLPFALALLLVLQDLILQEMLTCFYFGDLRAPAAVIELQQVGTAQFNLRRQILGMKKELQELGPKLPALSSGLSFDEGVCRALDATAAWAENEEVKWKAALSADDVLGGD